MQDATRSNRPAAKHPQRRGLLGDLPWLLVLLALAGGVRIWLIGHTEVTARDGIGFIRYAWDLHNRPWKEVLRENPHPPFYPVTVLATSVPLRHILSESNSQVM